MPSDEVVPPRLRDEPRFDVRDLGPPPGRPSGAAAAPAITRRSVAIGLLAVVGVAALAPYNDFVVANTFLIGGHLPIALVLVFTVLALANAPLHRFAPRHALSGGELAVAMAMLLAGCAIPGTGLLRTFLPLPVVMHHLGNADERLWRTFAGLDLPGWLFPAADRRDPVVSGFYYSVGADGSVPYGAWVVPLLGWGAFFAAMFTALVALAVIVRRQWAVNERLPFPLAQVEVALIEPPKPGRMFNDLFRSRLFWVSAAAVFTAQSFGALHLYFPRIVPQIPLAYDFRNVLSEPPWSYFDPFVQQSTIYFTFVAVAYFVQTRVSFSLWAFLILGQLATVQARSLQADILPGVWADQHLGSALVFLGGIAWVGRRHWAHVLRSAVRGDAAGRDDEGSYRWPVIAAGAGTAGMVAWLLVVGCSPLAAGGIVLFVLLSHVVTSRIVAETGLTFIRTDANFQHVIANLPAAAVNGRDVFFAGAMALGATYTARESVMSFALHGQQVVGAFDASRRGRRALVGLVALSLVVGYIVSCASSLACYYRNASPITSRVQTLINPSPMESLPRRDITDPLTRWADGRGATKAHDPWLHVGIGAAVTAALYVLTLRYAGWPLMPLGYLVHGYWYMQVAWFSVFLGWLAKALLVRFGGASLYQAARPAAIGMIFGEAFAAGAWLVVNLLLAAAGYDYQRTAFLPS